MIASLLPPKTPGRLTLLHPPLHSHNPTSPFELFSAAPFFSFCKFLYPTPLSPSLASLSFPLSFPPPPPPGYFDEALSSFFRNVDGRVEPPQELPVGDGRGKIKMLKARSVVVDMEEGVVNTLLKASAFPWVFSPSLFFVEDQEGALSHLGLAFEEHGGVRSCRSVVLGGLFGKVLEERAWALLSSLPQSCLVPFLSV